MPEPTATQTQPAAAEVELYDYLDATRTQQRYCCAGCWGHLTIWSVRGTSDVRLACHKCGDGRGFVTKAYAERRRSESLAEAAEAKSLLRKIGVLPKSTQTVTETLKELES